MEQHQTVAGLSSPFAAMSSDAQPTAVANPTPTQPQLSPTHPSYAEMITAAILWDSSQGKAGGSSKRAIEKYIDRVYSNLPPTHSALLAHHLKRLKNSGQLVMIKNSYQLPVVATATDAVPLRSAPPTQPEPQSQPQDSTPKKSPGRPPKAKSLSQTTPGSARPSKPLDSTPKKSPGRPPKPKTPGTTIPGSVNGPSTGKRPRGRPPRQQPAVAEVPFVQPVYDAPPDPGTDNGQTVKRRRGRPFKNKAADLELALVPVTLNGAVFGTPKKGPGRPPKAKGVSTPGIATVGSGKPRGRPKRNVLAPVGKAVGKKSRGRISKQAGLAPGVAGGKRRGRPPRGSAPNLAPWKLARKYAGKPRGRPRKNDASKQTSKQVAAYEELMKKVKNMQATVKDAVGVLRPFVPDEDGSDAMAALQQLEHLSTMSLTASPPPIPVEPPVTTTYEDSTVEVQPNTSVPGTENITVSTMVLPVVPFSKAAPTVGETAPLYEKQPMSWIPSSEAQL